MSNPDYIVFGGVAVPVGTVSLATYFNVKTYGGAAGDGVTDDTTAIQKTINAAAPVGGTVYFPHTAVNAPTLLITGATNASPIVIQTSTPHSYQTGQLVWVYAVGGNLNANGYWQVTVVDLTHFSLNGTTGSGAYTSSGACSRVSAYKVTAPLTIYPNIRFLGDGSTYLSGFLESPTSILDARIGASTPLITFTPDGGSPVEPTSRGCYFKGIGFLCPDNARTNYSFLVDGSAGITLEDCHFEGAEFPGGGDLGLWRLLAFEGVSFIRCTFQWGSKHLSFQGTGAGGPFKCDRCWFYDCSSEWVYSDSNGDHDYTFDGCAFDPLYRTTVPAIGVYLLVNGFSIRNSSFYGIAATQPTGSYIEVGGTGEVRGCAIHSNNAVALTMNGGNVDVSHNAFFAPYCINHKGGTLTGSGNAYTPSLIADSGGSLFPFEHKRAVIISEPYSNPVAFNLGPDQFYTSTDGITTYLFYESYHVGGQPSIGIITGTSSGAGGLVELAFQSPHGQSTGHVIDVQGVTGTTEANGNGQTVTFVDTTHLLLQGTTYSHAYTGGGRATLLSAVNYQQYTTGTINYAKTQDESTNGVVHGGIMTLNQTDPRMIGHGTGTVINQNEQVPNLISNEYLDSGIIYTLPPIVPGMVFEFNKRPDNLAPTTTPTMTIQADATDTSLGFAEIMLPGSAAGVDSINDVSTTFFNSRIRLRAEYQYDGTDAIEWKRWVVESADGAWQPTSAAHFNTSIRSTITGAAMTWSAGTVSSGAAVTFSFSLSNSFVGNEITIAPPATWPTGVLLYAFVSATGTVNGVAFNISGGMATIPNGAGDKYTFRLFQ